MIKCKLKQLDNGFLPMKLAKDIYKLDNIQSWQDSAETALFATELVRMRFSGGQSGYMSQQL